MCKLKGDKDTSDQLAAESIYRTLQSTYGGQEEESQQAETRVKLNYSPAHVPYTHTQSKHTQTNVIPGLLKIITIIKSYIYIYTHTQSDSNRKLSAYYPGLRTA